MSLRQLLSSSLVGLLVILFVFIAGRFLHQAGIINLPRTSVSDALITEPEADSAAPILSPSPLRKLESVRLVFLGDMMFDRHIRVNAKKIGYDNLLSPGLKKLFAEADLVIGNLEGPVTTNQSRSVGSVVGSPSNFIFTFDPAVVPFLYSHNIRLVNLGNNHILNFGQTGLQETYDLLNAGNVGHFGATDATESRQRWYSTSINGVAIAFVNYNQFTPDGYAQAMADLQAVEGNFDAVILYTHWGNEYVPENAVLKEQAAAFIAAGADLIIGSHPHVVTGIEKIGDATVYYSLGNFIFDQYFEPAVREGLVIDTVYNKDTGAFTFKNISVKLEPNGVTSLTDER